MSNILLKEPNLFPLNQKAVQEEEMMDLLLWMLKLSMILSLLLLLKIPKMKEKDSRKKPKNCL